MGTSNVSAVIPSFFSTSSGITREQLASQRCTSSWNKRRLGTPAGFQLTRSFREKSRTCWYDLPSGLPGGRSSPTITSLTRPRAAVFPGE